MALLALSPDPVRAHASVRAGARGYLLKTRGMSDLPEAVRRFALEGIAPLSPALVAPLLAELRKAARRAAPAGASGGRAAASGSGASTGGLSAGTHPAGAPNGLTVREAEVLWLLARGLTNADIARRLSLSPATVKTHVHNLLTKLHFSRRVELALYERDLGGRRDGKVAD